MNSPAFLQVEPAGWPSGYAEAIAVVGVQPDLFSHAFGLAFFDGVDNLDAYKAAVIRMRSGRMLGLLRHAGTPGPGTDVYADAGDDFVSALREFLDAFNFSVEDLSWTRDEIPVEDLRLTAQGAHA
ncbi:MAG TPA: hypothetical protein VGB92_22905 [Longimicrobium sp.]|jgi:hypothetical protein